VSVLLIEQKLTIAMKISDRALVMGHGASSSTARRPICAQRTRAQGVAGGLRPGPAGTAGAHGLRGSGSCAAARGVPHRTACRNTCIYTD
jgi:hypothetical protein